jgi:hypothetical protein
LLRQRVDVVCSLPVVPFSIGNPHNQFNLSGEVCCFLTDRAFAGVRARLRALVPLQNAWTEA